MQMVIDKPNAYVISTFFSLVGQFITLYLFSDLSGSRQA